MEGISLADIKAVTDNNEDGWGGNGGWWIILLFLVFFGGNGFGWDRGNNSNLTTDFAVLERKIDSVYSGICDSTYALNNSIKDGDYSLARDIQTVAAAQAQCCCDTNRNIDAVRYDAQKNTCDITTAIHKEGEATRALIKENEIQALRDKVGALELQSALCGVVRYPLATTYTAGINPYYAQNNCGCGGCGCNSQNALYL